MCMYVSGVSVMGDYGEVGGLASIISPVLPYKDEICITLNITTSPSMAVSINSVYNDSLHTEIARINTLSSRAQIKITVDLMYPRSQVCQCINASQMSVDLFPPHLGLILVQV